MKRAKLFQTGRGQVVRLPEEFHFDGTEVYVKHVGKAVVLLPVEGAWDSLVQSLDVFTDDYMTQRNQPPEQRREDLF